MNRRTLLKYFGSLPALALAPAVLTQCETKADNGRPAFDAKVYGAKGDAVVAIASTATGSAALTLASGAFKPTDVGKVVVVPGAGTTRTVGDGAIEAGTAVLRSSTVSFTSADVRSTVSIAGAGPGGATLVATLIKVSNPSVATISAPASATVVDASIQLTSYLTTTISSVSNGVATLAQSAEATVSQSNILVGSDDTAAINATMLAASGAGGANVVLPAGNYLTVSEITLDRASNLTVRAAGSGTSAIYRVGSGGSAVFHTLAFNAASPLTDFTMAGLTIDGSYMQGPFNVHNCGVRAQYLSRCTFRDLIIQGTLATGLGTDWLTNATLIHNVRASNCGAGSLEGSSGGGSAGIGIATGQHPVEEFTVSDCHASGNGTYGIFIESATGVCSQGMKISGCSAEGNWLAGFGDAGGAGATWSDCVSHNNINHGFENAAGTVERAVPGQGTVWVNCEASDNGSHGFVYLPYRFGGTTYHQANHTCHVTWRGSKSHSNGGEGWFVAGHTGDILDTLELKDCEAYQNGASGAKFTGSGALKNVVVEGGSFYDNGQSSPTDHYGIQIDCAATDVTIKGTTAYDSSGKQTHGLALDPAATITNLTVESNDFHGNAAGAVSNNAVLAGSVVFEGNAGYDQ